MLLSHILGLSIELLKRLLRLRLRLRLRLLSLLLLRGQLGLGHGLRQRCHYIVGTIVI